jgi:N-methylhydantoinase B
MMTVDPVTLEVMRNALYSITDEMSAALVRTAYSTNIKDRRDCSCAFYAADGKVIAQSEIGTPLHLGVMPKVIGSILLKYPTESMEEGDHYMLNTPYPAGPGHLNDITLMSPIHYKGKVIALVANQAHHVDVGGYAPGSMPFNVWEIFQEGMQIPAVKIISKGEQVPDVVDLIKTNIRTKNNFHGDFMAQVAANNVGRKRILKVCCR